MCCFCPQLTVSALICMESHNDSTNRTRPVIHHMVIFSIVLPLSLGNWVYKGQWRSPFMLRHSTPASFSVQDFLLKNGCDHQSIDRSTGRVIFSCLQYNPTSLHHSTRRMSHSHLDRELLPLVQRLPQSRLRPQPSRHRCQRLPLREKLVRARSSNMQWHHGECLLDRHAQLPTVGLRPARNARHRFRRWLDLPRRVHRLSGSRYR